MEVMVNGITANVWASPYCDVCAWRYVYIIRCKTNGKRYVGVTKNPKGRFKTHKYELRTGGHRNKALQNDFDQYGDDDFEIKIIARVPFTDGVKTEQYWIQRLKTYNRSLGYNNDARSRTSRGEVPCPWLNNREVSL